MGIANKNCDRAILGNYRVVKFHGKIALGLATRVSCKGKFEFEDGCYSNGVKIICWKHIGIGNCVWVGSRVTILKGAIVPDKGIVAAGSAIMKSIQSDEL